VSATLESVYTHFTERLSGLGSLVIAGGAVRDHLRQKPAKDFDLFLLGRALTDEMAKEVSDRLVSLVQVEPLEFHKSEPFLVGTVRFDGADVQIMVNPAGSLDALLDTFDWNVALFGYDGAILARESIENIAPGKDLRLNRVTFPLSTLRRGFRFSERFKMRLRREDVVELCRLVVERKGQPGPRGAEPDMPALAANYLATSELRAPGAAAREEEKG